MIKIMIIIITFVIEIHCLYRFIGLPDPFCKITVDSCPSNAITGNQCHTTDICKDTLSPKWNKNYDLYVF